MNGICLIWSRSRLISPSLPVGSTKATHGPKSRGKSFATTLWHHVQRYCCLGVLFAHAQVLSNSSSYHIRGNEMNCVGSSEYMTVFTSLTRASFLNMRADQWSSWLIRGSVVWLVDQNFVPKIDHFLTVLPYYSLCKMSKKGNTSTFFNFFKEHLDLFKTNFFLQCLNQR